MAVSGDELRDAARLARESVVVGRAVTLARWIGTGRRPVTAGQVLRKADVPAAGARRASARTPARCWPPGIRDPNPPTLTGIGWRWRPRLPRCRTRARMRRSAGSGRACRGRLPVIATLGDLHEVIQMLFGWDGDHLHVFRAGKKQYSDPLMDLDETRNEEAIRLRDAMAPNAGKISYTYDLGACWEHEITLERALPRDRGQDYSVCVAYKGDSPVEYGCEDDPEEPEPFDLAEVNRKLAALGGSEE